MQYRDSPKPNLSVKFYVGAGIKDYWKSSKVSLVCRIKDNLTFWRQNKKRKPLAPNRHVSNVLYILERKEKIWMLSTIKITRETLEVLSDKWEPARTLVSIKQHQSVSNSDLVVYCYICQLLQFQKCERIYGLLQIWCLSFPVWKPNLQPNSKLILKSCRPAKYPN